MSTPAGDDEDEWVDEKSGDEAESVSVHTAPMNWMPYFFNNAKRIIPNISFFSPTAPPPPPPYMTPPTTSTPINTLPAELLADIFQLGQEAHAEQHAEENSEVEEDEEDDYMPFEILASHVCRRWRDVALGTPSLWTFVDFGEGPPFERSIAYLQRSREAPLDVIIDCTTDSDDDDESDLEHGGDGNETEEVSEDEGEEIAVLDPLPEHVPHPPPSPPDTMSSLASRGRTHSSDGGSTHAPSNDGHVKPADLPTVRDLILPHASRWRAFDFRASSYAVVHGILHALSAVPELPILEELQLHHYEENEDDDESFPYKDMKGPILPFNGKAPRIKSVSLWGVHLDWENCTFLRSSTLEHLELAYHALDVRPPYSVFQSILTNASLTGLNLASSSPSDSPSTWPTSKINVPTLIALTLAQLPQPHVSALLTRLTLPNLKYLSLDFDPDDHSSTLDILSHPTHGLARGLESLKLNGLHASSAARKSFYAALGGLRELRMQAHHLPEHFIDALIPGALDEGDSDIDEPGPPPTSSNGTIKQHTLTMPLLTSLTIMGVDGELVRSLVHARKAAGAPLTTLMVERGDALDEEDEVWLRGNVEEFGYYDDSDDEDVEEFDVGEGVEVDMDDDDEEEDDDEDEEGDGEGALQGELDVD
ncbi:hypothetical protein PENSPDRAFT_758880 [Peniophora sp. CONT]|nr:hypothetical protein PENSPDRAFT_758880 [Peniophora sp. CONT]